MSQAIATCYLNKNIKNPYTQAQGLINSPLSTGTTVLISVYSKVAFSLDGTDYINFSIAKNALQVR